MRTLTRFAATIALAATPLAAQAQSATEQAAEAGQAPELTPEQLENLQRAIRIVRAFTAAINSDEVNEAVKGRLVSCLYGNTLAQISAATGEVFANSPNLDPLNPTDVYRASAGVCGVVFRRIAPGNGEGSGAPAAAETPPDGQTGR